VRANVFAGPVCYLEDSYGEGWIFRIKPDNFGRDVDLLGL
jgi:hypothetical protein